MGTEVVLLQFAKAPRSGHVKTRLVGHLTTEQACAVHCELVLWTCDQLLHSELGPVELHVTGEPANPLFAQCVARGVECIHEQVGDDLGSRMLSALEGALRHGDKAILVGSDCPGISPDYLRKALRVLDEAEIVIGPAEDGGFVLIGARATHAEMFNDIHWGGDTVFTRTCNNLNALGLSWHALSQLFDIDRPEDLPRWNTIRDGVE